MVNEQPRQPAPQCERVYGLNDKKLWKKTQMKFRQLLNAELTFLEEFSSGSS